MVYSNLSQEQKLSIQLSENIQEKVPSHELAESLWYYYKGYLAHRLNTNLEVIDRYATYSELPQEFKNKFSIHMFSELIKRTESSVRDAFNYQKLDKSIKSKVASGKINYSSALEISKIPKKKGQIDFVNKVKVSEITYKLLAEKVNEYLDSNSDFSLRYENVPNKQTSGKVYSHFTKIIYFINGFDNILSIDKLVSKLMKSDNELVTSLDLLLNETSKKLENVTNQINSQTDYLKELSQKANGLSLRDKILTESIDQKEGGIEEDKVGFRFKNVPTKDIILDPNQPRRRYNQQQVNNIAVSFNEVGQIEPIVVRRVSNNKYMVVAGGRRRCAADIANLKEMKVIIVSSNLTDAQIRILQFEENDFEEVVHSERAAALKNLKELKEQKDNTTYSLSEFSKQVSFLGADALKRALIFTTLDDKIKNLEDRGILKYSVAVELAEIKDLDYRYNFALEAILNNWTVSQVKTILKNRMNDEKAYPLKDCVPEVKGFLEDLDRIRNTNLRNKMNHDLELAIKEYLTILKKFDDKIINDQLMLKKIYLSQLAFNSLKKRLKRIIKK